MALTMSDILLRVVVLCSSLFTASIVLIRCFFRWIQHPTHNIFEVKERKSPPACLMDSNLGEHRYIKLKSIKLHYVEKGDKSKPLMIFVHGFPEFWYSWRHQIKEFSKDYWTVAIDQRGYGDSEKPDGRDKYKISILVEDIKELIEGLGRNKCILVAHDWGGVVGWSFASRYPEMVEKFIAMNAPELRAYRNILFKHRKQIFMSWYMFFFQLPYLPELTIISEDMAFIDSMFKGNKKSAVTEEDIEAYKYTFGKPGSITGPLNYYRANLFDSIIKINPVTEPKVSVPVLLIWGDKDKFLDQRLTYCTKRYVTNLTVEIIKGATHFVQQDDPVSTNAAMRRYLKN